MEGNKIITDQEKRKDIFNTYFNSAEKELKWKYVEKRY